MNYLIKKKGRYKTDKSHILSGKTYTFHMNMFLILLIYHLSNVFFYFPGAYSRIFFKNGNVFFALKTQEHCITIISKYFFLQLKT